MNSPFLGIHSCLRQGLTHTPGTAPTPEPAAPTVRLVGITTFSNRCKYSYGWGHQDTDKLWRGVPGQWNIKSIFLSYTFKNEVFYKWTLRGATLGTDSEGKGPGDPRCPLLPSFHWFLLFIFSVLGTGLRVSHLLGEYSSTELCPQPTIFYFLSLWVRLYIF